MDLEQILFIVIALALTFFSIYRKSKKQKQKQVFSENEETDFELSQEADLPSYFNSVFPPEIENDVLISPKNFNIYPKKDKIKQKVQKIEIKDSLMEKPENILQNADFQKETPLLEDFEGTEIQKAFLHSEIFKSIKN
jgi:hypothetical protein